MGERHVLVSVRSESTRLPDKCYLPMGDGTVLEHVLNRCFRFNLIPIVVTTLRSSDGRIRDICRDMEVMCYPGSVEDKMDRWLKACRRFDVNMFVAVDCDDPFFDPAAIELVLGLLETESLRFDVAEPDLTAYLGAVGYGMTRDALEKSCAVKESKRTEMIWKHFHPDLRIHKVLLRPEPIEKSIRLTLDYEEDYWLIRTVLRQLGPWCTRKEIVGFFKENPGLTMINLFRNIEWTTKQLNG